MDVYLTGEAVRALRALSLLSPREGEGLLLGHERGGRRLVERVLPTVRGFFPSIEAFAAANRALGGSVVGFFSFAPDRARLRRILAPFACQSVFVDVSGLGPEGGRPRAFLIRFDRTFNLHPMDCVMEKGGRRE
jgi:hypothetical protein